MELSAPVEKDHLKNKGNITQKKILPFVIQYHPALPKLKNILMGKWHLTQIKSEKNHQNISWSKLIYEDRGLKSLADGRNVMQARQYFKF